MRLIQPGLLQLNVLVVYPDSVFDPVLTVFQVISVPGVVWSDWHDYLLTAGVVPVERVVGAVTDHPDRCGDGERVTRDAHRRLFWRLLTLGGLSPDRDIFSGRDGRTAVAIVVLVVGWTVAV